MQRIRYVCSRQDVMMALSYVLENSPAQRHQLVRGGRSAAIMLALLGVLAWLLESWALGVTCIALAPVLFVLFPKVIRRTVIRTHLKSLDTHGQGIVGEHELETSDDGLVERTQYNETLIRWAAVKEAVQTEDREYLFIVLGSDAVHVVRRSSVVEGDLSAFLTELGTHVPVRSIHEKALPAPLPGRTMRFRSFRAVAAGMGVSLLFSPLIGVLVYQVVPTNMPWFGWVIILTLLLPVAPLLTAVYIARMSAPLADDECRCRRCRYILRGLRDPRCPECGEPI